MIGTIPVMRVNYTIWQLIKAAFIDRNSHKYREQLRDVIGTYFSTKNVMLTSSGRSAIYQIVRSLPQKKVIVPAYTCEVVVEAVQQAGKKVVFADINRDTLNIGGYPEIDIDSIVIATHQYGILCDMDEISRICKMKGAVLIEDCAGSFGGRIKGRLSGTFGDYGVFSFSASKTLHSPTKGGFIIAQKPELLERIIALPEMSKDNQTFKINQLAKGIGFCLARNRLLAAPLHKFERKPFGYDFKNVTEDGCYHHDFYEWQAYVVLKQFEDVESKLMERRKLFRYYDTHLSNALITKPLMQWGGQNIRYPILVADRERFIAEMLKNNIAVGKGYHKIFCPNECCVAKEIHQEIVYLPFGNGYSKKEINKVVEIVNSYR